MIPEDDDTQEQWQRELSEFEQWELEQESEDDGDQ